MKITLTSKSGILRGVTAKPPRRNYDTQFFGIGHLGGAARLVVCIACSSIWLFIILSVCEVVSLSVTISLPHFGSSIADLSAC